MTNSQGLTLELLEKAKRAWVSGSPPFSSVEQRLEAVLSAVGAEIWEQGYDAHVIHAHYGQAGDHPRGRFGNPYLSENQ